VRKILLEGDFSVSVKIDFGEVPIELILTDGLLIDSKAICE